MLNEKKINKKERLKWKENLGIQKIRMGRRTGTMYGNNAKHSDIKYCLKFEQNMLHEIFQRDVKILLGRLADAGDAFSAGLADLCA